MTTELDAFAEQLAGRFADLSAKAEVRILTEMISGGETFCSYHFALDLPSLRSLREVLRNDPLLWRDFRRAVRQHRGLLHWRVLLEHVYDVGTLEGRLKLLDQGFSGRSAADRRRLAAHLNCLDGEIGLCQDLADRRNLAARIQKAAGFPVIDGLTLRGFTYVLGQDPDLWHEFEWVVMCPVESAPGSARPPDAPP